MIARLWHGTTPRSKSEEYFDFLMKTGVKDYLAAEGNRGVYVLRKIANDRVDFLLISLWQSFDAVRKFSGPDIDKAVYYPKDKEFLFELEPNVTHYEVLVEPGPRAST